MFRTVSLFQVFKDVETVTFWGPSRWPRQSWQQRSALQRSALACCSFDHPAKEKGKVEFHF